MMYATNEVHYAFQIWFRPVQGRQLFELRTRTWYVHRTKYARPSFVYAPCDMMYVTNEILVIGNGKCRNCTSVYGFFSENLEVGSACCYINILAICYMSFLQGFWRITILNWWGTLSFLPDVVGTLPQSIFVCAQDQFELRPRTWYVLRTKYARPSFVYAPCDMMYATNEVIRNGQCRNEKINKISLKKSLCSNN